MNKLAAQAFIGKMICSVGQLQLVICNMIKLARCKACAVGATVHFRACIGVRDEPAVIQNIKEKKKRRLILMEQTLVRCKYFQFLFKVN